MIPSRFRTIVVTPVYEDVEASSQLFAELAAQFGGDCFCVAVDDGSVRRPLGLDGLRAARLEGVVLKLRRNVGHQRAISIGLGFASEFVRPHQRVVVMDSDGEDQPVDVPRLVHALDADRVPLAIAQRTKRSEPLRFRLMYLVFRTMFRVLTGTTVRSGNFAAQRAASLDVTIDHPSFDLCYSSSLLALRRPTTKVPCARGQRFAGRSRMSSYSLIAHGMRMLLPFSERIAVRMMVVSVATFAAMVVDLGLLVGGAFGEHPGWAAISLLVVLVTVFLATFTGFVVLFSGFAQASAVAMKGIGVPEPDPAS